MAMAGCDDRLVTHPEDRQIYYRVGRTASVASGHLEKGRAAVEPCSGHRPAHDEPGFEWANDRVVLLWRRLDRLDAAAPAARKTLRIDPGHEQTQSAVDDPDAQ